MLPLNLDVANWRILAVGQGQALANRVKLLEEAGAGNMRIHTVAEINRDGAQALGLPPEADIADARILFVAGLPDRVARDLADHARRLRVLVNVEDVPDLCDFHLPALVRRGDLTLALSTAGRAPGLASALRKRLESQFDTHWADRLLHVEAERRRRRHAGHAPVEIARATESMVAAWICDSA